MIRKRKKIRTMRGSRSVGGGSVKNRRGGGNRGGRGLAGSGKSKKTKSDYVRINFPGHIGRRGFKRPQKVIRSIKTINVQDLDQQIPALLESGHAQKKGDSITVDVGALGIEKVLGKGTVTHNLVVTAPSFSQSAVMKIEQAGGKAHASSR
ncbi:MAG: 50S ribosomal protein L15 [Theionarchaea archaeon]|nr:50S ribosomal protein L15 [Theionarchaea archaeon]